MRAFVRFRDLSPENQREAYKRFPHLNPIEDFNFYVRKDGQLHAGQGKTSGNAYQLSDEAAYRGVEEMFRGPRTKGDLRDWKPGVTFHFDNQHLKKG